MAFYEVIARHPIAPIVYSADTLPDAKELRDKIAATNRYEVVMIKQYFRRKGDGQLDSRILRTLTKRHLK